MRRYTLSPAGDPETIIVELEAEDDEGAVRAALEWDWMHPTPGRLKVYGDAGVVGFLTETGAGYVWRLLRR